MKFLKKSMIYLLIFFSVSFLFRCWLFRNLFTYHSIGFRYDFNVNERKLQDLIEAKTNGSNLKDINQIINHTLKITSQHLAFTTKKSDVDPNKLVFSRKTHCIGYAAFFTTSCNFLIKENGLDKDWTAQSHIGQINFLGVNIHNFFNSPFLRDHDFVIIKNKRTGELLAVDPSITITSTSS